jgi:hypothetical protein
MKSGLAMKGNFITQELKVETSKMLEGKDSVRNTEQRHNNSNQ